MASDRAQFNRALRKWDSLHQRQAYSESVRFGTVAILCSDYGMGDEVLTAEEEVVEFSEEAHRIAKSLAYHALSPEIFYSFSVEDAQRVIQNPEYSSIITIGNGSLSSIMFEENHIDWGDVSELTTHLKTGVFMQRHCGNSMRDLSVPLGTFCLSKHSNVRAARTGLPSRMTLKDEMKIRTLHQYPRLTYPIVKALFPSERVHKEDDDSTLER